jgi:NADH-quinone oxidoreductase subunit C
MMVALSGREIASKIEAALPGSVVEPGDQYVVVRPDILREVCGFLKDTPDLNFSFLSFITAIDYYEYFELVYLLNSLEHNHSLALKTRLYDRESPAIGSVVELWRGADFQEREIYDLFGISFEGHPNLKRIFMWEGFEGHPLRKDFM